MRYPTHHQPFMGNPSRTLGAVGEPRFGDLKGWVTVAALAGAGYYWKGAKGAAFVGIPALLILGYASAFAGDAMFQFLPPSKAA